MEGSYEQGPLGVPFGFVRGCQKILPLAPPGLEDSSLAKLQRVASLKEVQCHVFHVFVEVMNITADSSIVLADGDAVFASLLGCAEEYRK